MNAILDMSIFEEASVFISYNEVHRVPKHQHEFIEIAFIAEGEGEHIINGARMSCKKDDYFIVNKGVEHQYISKQKMIVYNCLFIPEFLDLSMTNINELTQMFTHHLFSPLLFLTDSNIVLEHKFTADEKTRQLFLEMYSEYSQKNVGYLRILQGNIIKLLITAIREMNTFKFNLSQMDNEKYDEIVKYICENFNKDIYLEELAKKMYISSAHFSRQFKKYVGLSLTKFIQTIRVSQASKLILNTDYRISEISNMVGYTDEKHFAKVFYRFVGVTPSKYRKNYIK